MRYSALVIVFTAVATNAQIQVCQNMKPGMVKAGSIKLASTAYSNSYSSLTVNWPRPEDGNPPSCITEYLVSVSGRDGKRMQQATVSGLSPVHITASYTAVGLTPGAAYQFDVVAKGPGGTGPADIRSTPFTAAPAPTSCRQPQAVTNIRREGAQPSGSMVMMTIAWDKPGSTADACIKDYIVTVYEAGSKTAVKSTIIEAPNTRYTDNIYYPGKQYEFFIFARNPSLGAMGNGVGLRSQPIAAPAQAVPV